jgi:DNA-directed RNA polymerase I and III subunit RPAC2
MPVPTVARVSAPEPADSKRLVVLAGERDSGDTCRTFIFHQENHTLGNSLRHMLLMNPRVVFAGYTIPHPAEDQMHLRIQTVEDYPAQTALKTALQDLKSLAVLSKQKFLNDVARYKKENPDCQKKEEPAV